MASFKGQLTPATAKLLIACERKGLSREDMCALAHVSSASLRGWIHKGRHATKANKCQAFAELFDAATAELTESLLDTIITAGTVGVQEVKTEFDPEGNVTKKTVTSKPDPVWAARVLRYKNPEKYAELMGIDKSAPKISINAPSQITVEYVGAPENGNGGGEIEVEGETVEDDPDFPPPGMLPS